MVFDLVAAAGRRCRIFFEIEVTKNVSDGFKEVRFAYPITTDDDLTRTLEVEIDLKILQVLEIVEVEQINSHVYSPLGRSKIFAPFGHLWTLAPSGRSSSISEAMLRNSL